MRAMLCQRREQGSSAASEILRTSRRADDCESPHSLDVSQEPSGIIFHRSHFAVCSISWEPRRLITKATATSGRHWKLSCLLSGLKEQHRIQTKQAARSGTLIQNHKMTGFSWNNKARSLEPDCLGGANRRGVVSLKSLSEFSQ